MPTQPSPSEAERKIPPPGPTPGPTTATPVRIYVLWHPKFREGATIAHAIYKWFRLDSMEGIPVFFRSTNARGDNQPLPIPDDGDLSYVLPLIEAYMVADPAWRTYVANLKPPPVSESPAANGRESRIRMYPIALDRYAYHVPVALRDTNFIRHDLDKNPRPETSVLLTQLTEILCRDLRGEETGKGKAVEVPGKIKLFLSHAKADGTRVAIRLKEYIQTHTQCETFFDETDIASGHDFARVLEKAIQQESAGMIAIHGDHYAERPWCRREIRRFQQPFRETTSSPEHTADAYFVPPLLVVENMTGAKIAKTIPELGHAPCLRWTEDGEPFVIRTLLREILLGLFYRRLIRNFRSRFGPTTILVNRPPDPVLVQQLLGEHGKHHPEKSGKDGHWSSRLCVRYPGYGMSQLEEDGLKATFPDVHFLTLTAELPPESRESASVDSSRSAWRKPSESGWLQGKTLRLATGNATDILSGGLDDEHNKELLVRLLRPLCRHRLSILYGGAMPSADPALDSGYGKVNFTRACLDLLLSERSADGVPVPRSARLYNATVWPSSENITEKTIAEWTDVCSFRRLSPKDAGLPDPPALLPPFEAQPVEFATPAERRKTRTAHEAAVAAIKLERAVIQARSLTYMRRQLCESIEFEIADRTADSGEKEPIHAFAHLFLGGKLETRKLSGVAPGLFEEILYTLEAGRPAFIIGAGYGAAGAVARWLTDPPSTRPPELSAESYLDDLDNNRLDSELGRIAKSRKSGSGPTRLADVLDGLWKLVRGRANRPRLSNLLNNGLDDEENKTLLACHASYGRICGLVSKGLRRLAGQE